MQTEKFYSEIRENLENSDFTPEWNKSQVWQRIEQKQGKKALSVWWKAVAAGIALVSLAGGYVLLENKNTTLADVSVKKPATVKSVKESASESVIEAPEQEQLNQGLKASSIHRKKIVPVSNEEQPNIAGDEIANEEFDNMVTTAEGEQEFSYNNITSRNEPAIVRPVIFDAPIIFRPNKAPEKTTTTAPAKRERVAILEIPEEEEDFVIAPKEKKKNKRAHLAKQVEKAPEATDPNKPNKIWAFVKQSFRNETMPADTTIK